MRPVGVFRQLTKINIFFISIYKSITGLEMLANNTTNHIQALYRL